MWYELLPVGAVLLDFHVTQHLDLDVSLFNYITFLQEKLTEITRTQEHLPNKCPAYIFVQLTMFIAVKLPDSQKPSPSTILG